MRWCKWFLIVWCCLLITCCNNNSNNSVVLHDTHGQQTTAAQLKTHWVIINYWAGWCEACMQEVPELNRFYKHVKNSQVVIYGVDYDRAPDDQVMDAVKKVHIDYPVWFEDPAAVWNLDSLTVVPTTFIINPQGKVVKMISGAVSEELLLNLLSELQSKS